MLLKTVKYEADIRMTWKRKIGVIINVEKRNIVARNHKKKIATSFTVLKLGRERTMIFPIVNVQGEMLLNIIMFKSFLNLHDNSYHSLL